MDGVKTWKLINYGLVFDGSTTASHSAAQWGQCRVGNGETFHLGMA